MTAILTLVKGDITVQAVDVIVNAANGTLLGGSGVDGAIHRAAGPKLLEECRTLGGCRTGEAKITAGYQLQARQVIHTVGPIWRGGDRGEAAELAKCYRNSLALAAENGLASIAFPAISTGVYGYPLQQATAIALRAVTEYLATQSNLAEIRFVCFSSSAYNLYAAEFQRHGLPPKSPA